MADGGTAKVEVSRAEGQRQFTSAEFYRMGEIGVIGPDERVELVGGLIYTMAPINPRHANAVDVLAGLLTIALDGRARVRGQNPVHLDESSDPQPDVAVVKLTADGYLERHPNPAEIHLLVEVADSTLLFDKSVKIPRYAISGVQEVWLVDLGTRLATVYREPFEGRYLSETPVDIGGVLSPVEFSDVAIPVALVVR